MSLASISFEALAKFLCQFEALVRKMQVHFM